MVLLSLPLVVAVENTINPEVVEVTEEVTVTYLTVLLEPSLINLNAGAAPVLPTTKSALPDPPLLPSITQ